MITLMRFAAALTFYTCLPIPATWGADFQRVACFAPLVGVAVGGLLGLLDRGLEAAALPILTRSALVVTAWIAITGGLHLDGAMDAADGLAVTDPKRRLEVMTDSTAGAFGVMAAVVLLLLKTIALGELHTHRWLSLMLAAGWGRWGQQIAIACYPYLKPTGKGAFHKSAIRSIWDAVPSLLLLLGLSLTPAIGSGSWPLALGLALGGIALAGVTADWFNRRLGGHTGDTYGAVVEWTEALLLVLLTALER